MSTKNMATSASEYKAIDTLTLWHKHYLEVKDEKTLVNSPVIKALQSDELDYHRIELEVEQLVANADVLLGFCGRCRWVLDHWPDIKDEDKALVDDVDCKIFTLGSAFHTRDIEASARAGCKFCLFLFSNLKANSELDTFRKIERRLHLLGSDETSTLMLTIDLNSSQQNVRLNYPQKMALGNKSRILQTGVTLSQSEVPTGE